MQNACVCVCVLFTLVHFVCVLGACNVCVYQSTNSVYECFLNWKANHNFVYAVCALHAPAVCPREQVYCAVCVNQLLGAWLWLSDELGTAPGVPLLGVRVCCACSHRSALCALCVAPAGVECLVCTEVRDVGVRQDGERRWQSPQSAAVCLLCLDEVLLTGVPESAPADEDLSVFAQRVPLVSAPRVEYLVYRQLRPDVHVDVQ